MKTIIQITNSGITISANKKEIEDLHNKFHSKHCFILKNFLGPKLLKFIQTKIQKLEFYEKTYDIANINAKDQLLKDESIDDLFDFLLNDEYLFKVIEEITGCPKIGSFGGRVYRMLPNKGHEYSWHDDLSKGRLVAISINLSTEAYKGGILQIKDLSKNKIITKVSNTGFGNAVFLHLAPSLKHRVTETIGKVNRTVFAGWFHSNKKYKSMFKSHLKDKFHSPKSNKIKITNRSLISTSQNLFLKSSNKDLIILDMNTNECYSIDKIGAKVIKMLSKPKTINELKASILKEFSVGEDKCEKDLLALISNLRNSNIVSIN